MKSVVVTFRTLRLHLSLVLGLCLGNVAWGAPSIQSIEVSPNPLTTGESFAITVTGSADVTRAIATVDFRPGEPRLLQIPLVQQGEIWTGSGLVPVDIRLQLPAQAGAMVKVILFDAVGRRIEGVVQVGVDVVSISAVFAQGILTVTGDDHNNTLIVSRDATGTLLVNGGAVPVIGGVPTIANTEFIRILGLGGSDVLRVDDGNGPVPPATLLGGEGNDTLIGSASIDELDGGPGDDVLFGRDGNDRLIGGPGNDTLSGDRGVDEHFGGEGDDQLIWNPGDGSDLIEGGEGTDTLLFIGNNADESVDISANGQRLRFFRNPGTITMDCNEVEVIQFNALGGGDTVMVNDLNGTGVTDVNLQLDSGLADTNPDTVIVDGTAGEDAVTINGTPAGVNVLGLSATVSVLGSEASLDRLLLLALAGNDVVEASELQVGVISLTVDGGSGDDVLVGGAGNDTLLGDEGDDVLNGGPGSDVLDGGPGDNVVIQD